MGSTRSLDDNLQRSQRNLFMSSNLDPLIPPIQRSLGQVTQVATSLISNNVTTASPAHGTRFLSRSGINTRNIADQIQLVQFQSTHEDMFPEASNPDEFLRQVEESNYMENLRMSQEKALNQSKVRVNTAKEEYWSRHKTKLLDNLRLLSTNINIQNFNKPINQYGNVSNENDLLLQSNQVNSSAFKLAYAKVVNNMMNKEYENIGEAIHAFFDAYKTTANIFQMTREINIFKIWALITSIAESKADNPALNDDMAIVMGIKKHMEESYSKFLVQFIERHEGKDLATGLSASLKRVRAALRIKLRNQLPLDFDAPYDPSATNTTWHQIYTCFRAGYYKDAVEVAKKCKESKEYSDEIAEWVRESGRLSPSSAKKIASKFDALFLASDSHASVEKFVILCIIGRGKKQKDKLISKHKSYFYTSEDYIWFHLSMLNDLSPPPPLSPSPSPPASPFLSNPAVHPSSSSQSPSTSDFAMLEELQRVIRRVNFSSGRKDCLHEAYMHLCSMQFTEALKSMLNTVENTPHVVHMSMCMMLSHSFTAITSSAHKGTVKSQSNPTTADVNVLLSTDSALTFVANVIKSYASELEKEFDLAIVMQYYLAAVRGMRECGMKSRRIESVFKHALVKHLCRSNGVSFFVLSKNVDKLEFEKDFVAEVLLDAAKECRKLKCNVEALLLFVHAEQPLDAIHLTIQMFSELIEKLCTNLYAQHAEFIAIWPPVKEYLEKKATVAEDAEEEWAKQKQSLDQICVLFDFFRCVQSQQALDGIRALKKLPYFDLDASNVDECALRLNRCDKFVVRSATQVINYLVASKHFHVARDRFSELKAYVARLEELKQKLNLPTL